MGTLSLNPVKRWTSHFQKRLEAIKHDIIQVEVLSQIQSHVIISIFGEVTPIAQENFSMAAMIFAN